MSVKQNLKRFKAYLHWGDASHPPMHTESFYGNQYDLNVLIRQAEAEGEPLRVQIEDEGSSKRRSAAKRKVSGRAKPKRSRALRRFAAKRRHGASPSGSSSGSFAKKFRVGDRVEIFAPGPSKETGTVVDVGVYGKPYITVLGDKTKQEFDFNAEDSKYIRRISPRMAGGFNLDRPW